MKNDTHKVVENIASAYVNSKVPGRGAAPHEGFKSNKISNTPYKAPKTAPKEPSIPKAKSKDYARLSESFEKFTPDVSSFNDPKELGETSGSMMGRQIRDYMDGR